MTKKTLIAILEKSRHHLKRNWNHLKHFQSIWWIIATLLIVSLCVESWRCARLIMWGALIVFAMIMMRRPMGVVYGLIGGSGGLGAFFFSFFIICLLFASIYHLTFFSNSKVTYDTDPPHICFDMEGLEKNLANTDTTTIQQFDIYIGDTVIVDHIVNGKVTKDTMVYHDRPVAKTLKSANLQTYRYQPVSFGFILKNTIMTSLIQSPTDFFSIVFNHDGTVNEDGSGIDKQKATLFSYVLIVQILISWLFLGVLLSILFNKYRYES